MKKIVAELHGSQRTQVMTFVNAREVCFLICCLLLAACKGAKDRLDHPIDLVPSSSIIVASLDWNKVSNDRDLMKLIRMEQIIEQLQWVERDGGGISTVIYFSDGKKQSDGCNGAIVLGKFSEDRVKQSVIGRGWREDRYERFKRFVDSNEKEWLLFLESRAFVVGSKVGIEAVEGRKTRSRKDAKMQKSLEETLNYFSERKPAIYMAIGVPERTQEAAETALTLTEALLDLSGVGAVGEILGTIGIAQSLGIALSPKNEFIEVELLATMSSQKSARFVAGAIDLLRGATVLIPQGSLSPEERNRLRTFETATVNRKKELLSVTLAVERSALMAN